MIRYVRAFVTALRLTLRGEEAPQAPWQRWLAATARHIEAIERSAGPDVDKVVLRIEGRDMSMAHILDAVRYHVTEEYPYLLHNPTEHTLMALQASNVNDHFWLMKLEAAPELQNTPALAAVTALRQHLEALPSSSR